MESDLRNGSLLELLVRPLLADGERVVWSACPTHGAFHRIGWGMQLLGTIFSLIGLVLLGVAFFAASEPHAPRWMALVVGAGGFVFAGTGAACFLPLLMARDASAKVVYAITDRRVIIGTKDRVLLRAQSFEPEQLRRALLANRRNSVALIPFAGGGREEAVALSSVLGGHAYDFPPGFFGVKDPAAVLDLVAKLGRNGRLETPDVDPSPGTRLPGRSTVDPSLQEGSGPMPVEVGNLLAPGEELWWFSRAEPNAFKKYSRRGLMLGIVVTLIGLGMAAISAIITTIFHDRIVGGLLLAISVLTAPTGITVWILFKRKVSGFSRLVYAVTSLRALILRTGTNPVEFREFAPVQLGQLALHWNTSESGEVLFRNVASHIGSRKWHPSMDLPTTSVENMEWVHGIPPGFLGVHDAPRVQRLVRRLVDSHDGAA